MSTKKKLGRPSTGITKEKPSVLIAKDVMKQARKLAFGRQMTLSAFIEESLKANIETLTAADQ